MRYKYSVQSSSQKYQNYCARINIAGTSVVGELYCQTDLGMTFVRDFRSAMQKSDRFAVKLSGAISIHFRMLDAVMQ